MTEYMRGSKSNPLQSYDDLFAKRANLRSDLEELEEQLRDTRRDMQIELSHDELKALGAKAVDLQTEIIQYEKALKEIEVELASYLPIPSEEMSDKWLSDDFTHPGGRRKCPRCQRVMSVDEFPDGSNRCFTCLV